MPKRRARWTSDDYRAATARSIADRIAHTTQTTGPGPHFDPLALITALNSTGLPYIVIGGLAAVVHGSPRRTADLDLMAFDLRSRLEPIAQMLRDVQAIPYGSNGTTDGISAAWLRHRPSFPLLEFHTALGGLDLDDYGDSTYRRVEKRSIRVQLGEQVALFAGLDDLIGLKQRAGRPQDLDDLAILERARGDPTD